MDARTTSDRFTTDDLIYLQSMYGTNHYRPYPIAMRRGKGIHLWDLKGKKYLDMNATYSAIAVGHNNIELRKALNDQARLLTSISNVFLNERAPVLLQELCERTGQDKAILMNTGAEAFETAVKAARRWAHRVKRVPEGKAEIVVASNNFHGRTITAISASSNKEYQAGYGPLTPGFVLVPFGDVEALAKVLKPETAAFIVEPIQGEGGINMPPSGYFKAVRELCTRENVLLGFDEVQTGFGRTGKLFAFEHYDVKPDLIMLGKALGGYYPVSAVAGKAEVMKVFTRGSHGSTFGGNPVACAVALKQLELITRDDEALVRHVEIVGNYFFSNLLEMFVNHPDVLDIRGKGLFIGLALDPKRLGAMILCLRLLDLGVIAGAAKNNVVRFSPPLIFSHKDVDEALARIWKAFNH